MKARTFVTIMTVCLLLGCLGNWPESYEVKIRDEACIKPHRGYRYLTCAPMHVQIDELPVVVPSGFDTDLASIPRVLWSFLAPTHSSYIAASILHDYLYACTTELTRYQVDSVFYNAMRDNKVPVSTALKMYYAVRIFGGRHYECKD